MAAEQLLVSWLILWMVNLCLKSYTLGTEFWPFLQQRRGGAGGGPAARCAPGGGDEHAQPLGQDPARRRDRAGQLPDRRRLADQEGTTSSII